MSKILNFIFQINIFIYLFIYLYVLPIFIPLISRANYPPTHTLGHPKTLPITCNAPDTRRLMTSVYERSSVYMFEQSACLEESTRSPALIHQPIDCCIALCRPALQQCFRVITGQSAVYPPRESMVDCGQALSGSGF